MGVPGRGVASKNLTLTLTKNNQREAESDYGGGYFHGHFDMTKRIAEAGLAALKTERGTIDVVHRLA